MFILLFASENKKDITLVLAFWLYFVQHPVVPFLGQRNAPGDLHIGAAMHEMQRPAVQCSIAWIQCGANR